MAPATRLATPDDAEELTRLRRLMFESMGVDVDATPWQDACVSFFRRRLGLDDVVAVVVDAPDGQGLASSGVIEIAERIPRPRSPSGRSGYISTISTDPRYQRQGMARAVMDALMSLASARGLDHVELHATDQGRPIYEKLGFVDRPASPSMSVFLEGHPPRGAGVPAH